MSTEEPRRVRLDFIDNIRWTIIFLVLSMHSVDTYSPFGNWYFSDKADVDASSAFAFGVYQAVLQAFFMALLFFSSGYFAAPALRRKGGVKFARERFIRLGLPTLLYIFFISPPMQYFMSKTWGSGGFGYQWLLHLRDGEWLSNTGPMWFCAALLVFSLVYGVMGAKEPIEAPVRCRNFSFVEIATFVVLLALATFVTRIFIPEERSILNMHLGDFPSYLLMFCAGIVAYRRRWLEAVDPGAALTVALLCLALSLPPFVWLLSYAQTHSTGTSDLSGGLTLASGVKCIWEALICVGMSSTLIAGYKAYFNGKNKITSFFSDNAFSVYVFHPPVVVGLGMLFVAVKAPPIAKAALLTISAIALTYGLSAILLRRIPLLKRIL